MQNTFLACAAALLAAIMTMFAIANHRKPQPRVPVWIPPTPIEVIPTPPPQPNRPIIQQPVKPPQPQEDPLIAAHNAIRQQHGAQALQTDPQLMEMAQRWAEHMAQTHNMRHQALRGGPGWRGMGENIAEGQRSIEEVMQCWMKSSGHRRNILNKGYTHIGVGMAKAANGTLFWCVDFGSR